MIFEEKVEVVDNLIKITVTCEYRKTVYDEKKRYGKDISDLIPEKFKNRVSLVSKPHKTISNIKDSNNTNTGTWIFEIKPATVIQKENKTKKTIRKGPTQDSKVNPKNTPRTRSRNTQNATRNKKN